MNECALFDCVCVRLFLCACAGVPTDTPLCDVGAFPTRIWREAWPYALPHIPDGTPGIKVRTMEWMFGCFGVNGCAVCDCVCVSWFVRIYAWVCVSPC